MLGTDLAALLGDEHQVTAVDLEDWDVTHRPTVEERVAAAAPEVIINAAAFTDVDGSEKEEPLAFRVNADGPENLARACKGLGIPLVHVSTDYVFDGTKPAPYREDDPANPLGAYGRSKWEGEQRIRALLEDACIVRTAWLYGRAGRNFVEAILRQAETKSTLRVVNDQQGSPTYTRDLALALRAAAVKGLRGTYHVTNRGACTWFDFAREILDQSGRGDVAVEPISSKELGRPAPRPDNSVLDCGRFEKDAAMRLRAWNEALRDYLEERSS